MPRSGVKPARSHSARPRSPRSLEEIYANLVDRLEEARQRVWLGEVAAIETTVAAAAQKLEAMCAAHNAPVHLGVPDIRTPTGRSSAMG